MAITCPRCGAEFDVTLFQFGHRVRCHCGAEVAYPGTDQREGHVVAQGEHMLVATQPPQDPDHILRIARAAGEQLVVDLDQACQLTDHWEDEKLVDMLVEAALAKCLHRLAETDCWGVANRLPSSEFWRIAGPLLEVGVLQRHARLKPRGYAGDYQMLHWIGTDYCCDHPLGRAFDRYFQGQAAPQAVRCRTRQTAAALVAHCLQAGDAGLSCRQRGLGTGHRHLRGPGLLAGTSAASPARDATRPGPGGPGVQPACRRTACGTGGTPLYSRKPLPPPSETQLGQHPWGSRLSGLLRSFRLLG